MTVPTSPIYKLDLAHELNQPWYHYARGGQGMHIGLGEDDRYAVLCQIAGTETFVFANITTGKMVAGPQPLDRFVEA